MAGHASPGTRDPVRAAQTGGAQGERRRVTASQPPSYARVTLLQRTVGNRATAALLRQPEPAPPQGSRPPTISPEASVDVSADEEAQFDDDAAERVASDETWAEVKSGALGLLYGTAQGVAPGGFVAPSPAPEDRTFEFFRGAGQLATGIAEMASGALGEVGGLALDATGIGAPVGVAVNVGSAAVIVQGATSAAAGVGTLTHAMQMSGKPRESWLPKKGTPERRALEAARKRGIAQKQARELADIKAGGKGSGVWTEEELQLIRETERFPADVRWHHDPPVALRPDLAGDPAVVRPVRGGHAGHLAAHGGSFVPRTK